MSSISKPSARLKRVVFLATFISVALFLITCEKDTDHPTGNSKLVVNEITPAQVLYTMVSLQASIEANGHGSVLNHGFCYSLESNPDKSDSIVNLGVLSKEESFSATINNLAPATKYFFRAFADIPSGTIWSKEFSFVTLKTGKPLLFTDSVYSVSVSAASFSGTIVADSGLAITRRGFSWGKNSFPGMLDSISEISGTTNNFTFKLQGLEFATKYYFKAFAENQAGISFGSTLEFETLADIPSVTTGEAHSITQSDAVCAGEVTSDGGAWVAARGICWGMTENPTIFGEHSSEGNGTGQFETTLFNLTPSATYYYRAYASNSGGIAYGAQRSFKTSSAPVLPVVNTAAITNITTNYALSGGNVTSDGGLTVTAKGLCWGTKPSPTLKDSFSNDGNGTGSFITNIINLAPGTTYYVRAYATNSLGTAFGNELSFTTETAHTIPTVITNTVTSITSSSAVSGGNVTNTGGDAVTSRGVCWSTSQNPTLTNNHTIDGSGSGSFTSNLTGLSPSTTYYVRAYATNISGTAYGQQLSFTTSATVVVPSVITANISSITSNSALSGGNISNDGGASVTARGVCWSTTPSPTLSNSFTTDGNGTGTFSSEISGLNANTTYYVRAYATNSAGTAYGDQKSFTTLPNATTPTVSTAAISSITSSSAVSGGNVTSTGGASVTARGVCWSTSQNPTIFNSHTTDGSGAGSFVSNLTGLSPSTTYYVRAYATNSQGTAYGNQLNFTTSANVTLPSVTTAAITNITSSSATSGGNVTSSGGANVTARGVCWSTNQNPTLSDNFTTNGSGTGSFVSDLTGLNPSTTYYVRAYATNSQGTSYGNQESFTTTSSGIQCNDFTLTHTAGSVAPVSKTVNYNVTLTDLSGETKCWITQNLGADHEANSATDASEASAGWYWVFNKKQGFKHDGTIRVPDTQWIYPTNENSNWLNTNDPCFLLLGETWRIPTYTEWNNVDLSGSWENYFDTYSSELKLHAAGFLHNENGNLLIRGIGGRYWSSNQISNGNGWLLNITNSNCFLDTGDKSYGFSIRCLSDGNSSGITLANVITTNISNTTQTSATSGGEITSDGGAPVTARGVCWSINQSPTLNDDFTTDGSGTGTFVSNLSGLYPSTTYYVRAYATNSVGTAYGNQVSFTTTSSGFVCGNTLTINHIAGEVAPVNKTVNYGTVETNLTGSNKCWITQNLGADRQALSATDDTEASAGWYWQFNRKQGYKHDGITRTPNTTWITSINENSDWLIANDPCTLMLGSVWRLHTASECQMAILTGGWENYIDAYASVLKLHAAGSLGWSNGLLYSRGSVGNYWSSSQYDASNGQNLNGLISGSTLLLGYGSKSFGFSIRCLKD